MAKKVYVVQELEGYNGLEFLSDDPVGRRCYGPGEEVELDSAKHDIQGLLDRGVIAEAPKSLPASKPMEAAKDKDSIKDKED